MYLCGGKGNLPPSLPLPLHQPKENKILCTYSKESSVKIGDDVEGDWFVRVPVPHNAVDLVHAACHVSVAVLYMCEGK